MDDIFEQILEIIWDKPDRWLMSFENEEIALEYFSKYYSGELEAGCGAWAATGSPGAVLRELETDKSWRDM